MCYKPPAALKDAKYAKENKASLHAVPFAVLGPFRGGWDQWFFENRDRLCLALIAGHMA